MNSQYRILPVELSPAIKDAIVASGHFQPLSLWAAIIAAHDLVAGLQAPCDDSAPILRAQREALGYAPDAARPAQTPIQSGELTIDRYELVEKQFGSGYGVWWEKALELDPTGEWCKFADVQRLAAPAAQQQAANNLTECRHCGFYVALNRAPADVPAQQQASTDLPADVRAALDRMCTPLCSSRLDGATAEADAMSMAVLKRHIESTVMPVQEQAAIVPAGWKLVPVSPTMRMTEAGRDARLAGATNMDSLVQWRAMLAAAPPPPVAQAHALTDAAFRLLQTFVDYHAKPAGLTLEKMNDRNAFGEFIGNIEAREKSMVECAKELITAHLTRKGA